MVRFAAAVYALIAFVTRPEPYQRPWLGWLVLIGIFAWSAFVALQPRRRRPLVIADLVVATIAVLLTAVVDTRAVASATNTLPLIWPAAAVMSWAVWRGAVAGVIAAAVIGAADLVVVDPITRRTVHSLVLLGFAGGVVGFAAELYERTRRDIAVALEQAAASRERDRLARDIHDSVLQVLAFVQRRGAEIGGEAADLGRLAGDQEVRLRALVLGNAAQAEPSADGVGSDMPLDVLAELRHRAGARVKVSGPAGRVELPPGVGRELVAAVDACLHNVDRHAGPEATAFILVEDEPGEVVVSVRDDGVGFAAGRLEEARNQGRLGVASSITGRIDEAGGSVQIWSQPGQGVEIELRMPKGDA